MGLVPDDGLHSVPQGGKNKAALHCQDIVFLISHSKTVRTSSGEQDLRTLFLFAKLGLEVHIIVNDRADFICDFPARFPCLHLCLIFRVMFLFSPVQIAVGGDQFPDALLHLGPGQQEFAVRVAVIAGNGDTLAIVIFPIAAAGDGVGVPANAILIPQEFDIFLLALIFLELLKNAVLPLGYAAPAAQDIVNGLLGNGKGRSLFRFGLFNERDLLRFAGEGALIRGKPLVKQDHPVNGVSHGWPAHEHLPLTGEVRPAPEGQHIVPRPIPGPLSIGQDHLNVGVIEKGLDKIAALLAAWMVGKEGGDFRSVVFQGVAGAEQFAFFAVLVIVVHVRTGVKVVMPDFKPGRASR